MLRTGWVSWIALALAACAAEIPRPTLRDAGGDAALLRDLEEGRHVYVGKCGGCHGLLSVTRYPDAVWEEQVREMVRERKVKLGGRDRGLLVRYLTTLNDPAPAVETAPAPDAGR